MLIMYVCIFLIAIYVMPTDLVLTGKSLYPLTVQAEEFIASFYTQYVL